MTKRERRKWNGICSTVWPLKLTVFNNWRSFSSLQMRCRARNWIQKPRILCTQPSTTEISRIKISRTEMKFCSAAKTHIMPKTMTDAKTYFVEKAIRVCVCVGGGVSCFVNILGSLRMRYISMDSEKNINSINKNGGRWANAYRWAEYLYNIFFRIGVCVCALSVEPLQSMIIYLMRCFSFVCAFLFVCLFVCLPRFLFSQIEYCCLLAAAVTA